MSLVRSAERIEAAARDELFDMAWSEAGFDDDAAAGPAGVAVRARLDALLVRVFAFSMAGALGEDCENQVFVRAWVVRHSRLAAVLSAFYAPVGWFCVVDPNWRESLL